MADTHENAEIVADDTTAVQVTIDTTGDQNARDSNRNQGFQEEGNTSSLEEPTVKKARFDLKHIVSEAEQRGWTLPDELAEYFSLYAKMHVAEADLKADLELENFQPPSNIDCVPVMDANLRNTLKKEGSNAAIDVEH